MGRAVFGTGTTQEVFHRTGTLSGLNTTPRSWSGLGQLRHREGIYVGGQGGDDEREQAGWGREWGLEQVQFTCPDLVSMDLILGQRCLQSSPDIPAVVLLQPLRSRLCLSLISIDQSCNQ